VKERNGGVRKGVRRYGGRPAEGTTQRQRVGGGGSAAFGRRGVANTSPELADAGGRLAPAQNRGSEVATRWGPGQ
jgi:hypothetical protein